MAEQHYSLPQGELQVHGWAPETMDAAARLGEDLVARAATPRGPISFEGGTAYLKGAPLSPRPARRHALRRLLWRAKPPRVAEYENLCWLLNRHFETPIPLAAGVLIRRGLPRYQFLLTAMEPALPFEEAFPTLQGTERQGILEELGRETARFHSLHFIHRDLYPRNLLLRPKGAARRVLYLDAWAGGPGWNRRGADYDLACLLLDGPRLFHHEDQARLLGTYFAERQRQDSPVQAPALFARIQRNRRRLRRQLIADPGRQRGKGLPPEHWEPPTLAEA